MGTTRLVQGGALSQRPLVIVYHAAAEMDERIKVACGQYPTIVNYTAPPFTKGYFKVGENGLPGYRETADKVIGDTGAVGFSKIILCGFSEGCQAVRAQLVADHERGSSGVRGVVCIDGVHSNKPLPQEGSAAWDLQVGTWRHWLDVSSWGSNTNYGSVFTHTEIDPGKYSSVRATLETVMQTRFDKGLNVDTPAVAQSGRLEVWSFPGNKAEDHSNQLLRNLPRALNRCLYFLGEFDLDNNPALLAFEGLLAAKGKPSLTPGGTLPEAGKTTPLKKGSAPLPRSADGQWWPLGLAVAGVGALGAGLWYWRKKKGAGSLKEGWA